jgi:hypothetical protein
MVILILLLRICSVVTFLWGLSDFKSFSDQVITYNASPTTSAFPDLSTLFRSLAPMAFAALLWVGGNVAKNSPLAPFLEGLTKLLALLNSGQLPTPTPLDGRQNVVPVPSPQPSPQPTPFPLVPVPTPQVIVSPAEPARVTVGQLLGIYGGSAGDALARVLSLGSSPIDLDATVTTETDKYHVRVTREAAKGKPDAVAN